MNLAEPSGSSPPEKPPGIMTIWLLADAARQLARALGDVVGREVVDHEHVRHGAGRASNARAVSYSQLLPGNTGMITRGRAKVSPE